MISHARNPNVMCRARDLYAVYCSSSDGKNYQGLACPAWDALTDAVRGHWYVVALRTLELGVADLAADGGMADATTVPPNDYVVGHLPDPSRARHVWADYSGLDMLPGANTPGG